MKKEDVIKQYKALVHELGESAHNVVLSAGAAAVMMDLRPETEDLDVDVLPGVFKWAATTKTLIEEEGVNPRLTYSENIDLHVGDEDRGRVCIDGVWVYSPHELILQKQALLKVPNRGLGKLVQDQVELAMLEDIRRSAKYTARAV